MIQDVGLRKDVSGLASGTASRQILHTLTKKETDLK